MRKHPANITKFSKDLHTVGRRIIHLNLSLKQDQSQVSSSIRLEIMEKTRARGPNLSIENYDILTITIPKIIGIAGRKSILFFFKPYKNRSQRAF